MKTFALPLFVNYIDYDCVPFIEHFSPETPDHSLDTEVSVEEAQAQTILDLGSFLCRANSKQEVHAEGKGNSEDIGCLKPPPWVANLE